MWFSPTLWASTRCIVIAGCFWWWTYLQFLTMVWYGIPHVTSLNGSGLHYFLRPEGLPFHIPRLYLLITILAYAVVAAALPAILEGSKAKLRQIALLAVFQTIALSVAIFVDRSETGEIEKARWVIEQYNVNPDYLDRFGLLDWKVPILKEQLAEIDSY